MFSTIDTDLQMIDGAWHVVPKEYPNWYGIEDIGFIWFNSWADPYLEYKGHQFNSVTVEESMWEMYREDCKEKGVLTADDEFEDYMRENVDSVYEFINAIISTMRGVRE